MTRNARLAIALLIFAGAFAAAGCDFLGPEVDEFVIQVDSVQAPGAVSGGAPFEVRFYGFVGPDGCYSFKDFRVSRTQNAADVTVIGQHHQRSGIACADALVFLDGRPLTIEPPVSDPFTLRVRQPNGTVLTVTVRAE